MLAFAGLALCADSRKAQREYEQGIRLEQAGHWQEAYEAFSASLGDEPTAAAYLHRAKTQLALNLPDKAIDDLTEAIRLDPKNPDALRWRSETYAKLGNQRGVIADLTALFDLGVETSRSIRNELLRGTSGPTSTGRRRLRKGIRCGWTIRRRGRARPGVFGSGKLS